MTLSTVGRVQVPISISLTEILSVKEWRDIETGGRGR